MPMIQNFEFLNLGRHKRANQNTINTISSSRKRLVEEGKIICIFRSTFSCFFVKWVFLVCPTDHVASPGNAACWTSTEPWIPSDTGGLKSMAYDRGSLAQVQGQNWLRPRPPNTHQLLLLDAASPRDFFQCWKETWLCWLYYEKVEGCTTRDKWDSAILTFPLTFL